MDYAHKHEPVTYPLKCVKHIFYGPTLGNDPIRDSRLVHRPLNFFDKSTEVAELLIYAFVILTRAIAIVRYEQMSGHALAIDLLDHDLFQQVSDEDTTRVHDTQNHTL